ncbi:MAG: hypothetical protein GXO73_04820 [Calditrichaeota bacterium]|nr:hypothetical protein [Calditrichota bacterium]
MGSLKTTNVLYLAAFFAGALLVVNVFLVSPSRKMKALRQELVEVQEQISEAEAELDSLRHQPAEESNRGAGEKEEISPIELLTKRLSPRGLVFKRLETSRGEGGIFSFSLDARGSFATVVQYLHNISTSPTPILILDMSISPETDDGRTLNLQISGQLASGGQNG